MKPALRVCSRLPRLAWLPAVGAAVACASAGSPGRATSHDPAASPERSLPAQPPADRVHVAGGAAEIGTDPAEIAMLLVRYDTDRSAMFEPETPALRVRLQPYWIDRFEVTNAQFAAFVVENAEWRKGRIPARLHNGDYLRHWSAESFPPGTDRHPVTFVSWYAAAAYCRSRGGRLPSEAEWEFAARGAREGETFTWGPELPDPSVANWLGSEIAGPVSVGSYPPNQYGLHDMAGNVWEFTADEWTDRRDAQRAAQTPRVLPPLSAPGRTAKRLPAGPPKGSPAETSAVTSRRVIRGGSFAGTAINLRVRFRDSHPPEGAGPHVGFRCASSAP